MTPTRLSLLATLAGISVVLGMALADLFDQLSGRMLPVPWSSVVTMTVVALALLGWAWSFRRRLRAAEAPIDPFVAVRTAALAMAASRGRNNRRTVRRHRPVVLVRPLDPLARERALLCVGGVVASLVLVLAALWLERICRLPDDQDPPGGLPSAVPDDGDWVHPRTTLPDQQRPARPGRSAR